MSILGKTTSAFLLFLVPQLASAATYASGSAKGTDAKPITVPGWPGLQTVEFRFSSQDHHILRLGAYLDQGKVHTQFRDNNPDDYYSWKVGYESIQGPGIISGSAFNSCDGGECVSLTERPPGDYVFVISGFTFSYLGFDHHIDRVMVWENQGQLRVRFADKNNDDKYQYSVQYVWVPRSKVSQVVARSGSGKREALAAIPRGKAVISGFSFDFANDDHHIRNFGLSAIDGNLKVGFGDKNGDDLFRYNVAVAILKP